MVPLLCYLSKVIDKNNQFNMWLLMSMVLAVALSEHYETSNPYMKYDASSTRTKVYLRCGSDGIMRITLTFHHPFCGVIYPGDDTNSICTARGDGSKVAKVHLPLYGCGTTQHPMGTFVNHLTVKSDLYSIDEIITIKCHYINNSSTTTTTSTTTITPISSSTTTPNDVIVIEPQGRDPPEYDADKSNVEININQASVVPWILIILAFIVLLCIIACCIYCCSKRKFRFVTTTPTMGSESGKSIKSSQLIWTNHQSDSITDLTIEGSKQLTVFIPIEAVPKLRPLLN